MVPLRVLPMIASSNESTIAASWDRSSSAFLRPVTSRIVLDTRVPSSVSTAEGKPQGWLDERFVPASDDNRLEQAVEILARGVFRAIWTRLLRCETSKYTEYSSGLAPCIRTHLTRNPLPRSTSTAC